VVEERNPRDVNLDENLNENLRGRKHVKERNIK